MARHIIFSVLLLSILFCICCAGIIEPSNCEGISNRVSNVIVDISDCDNSTGCTLYKGRTYYMKTTFTPDQDFTGVKMRTLGVMGLLKVPYQGNSPVCEEAITEDGDNCNPEVGLVQGKAYTHSKGFPVRNVYPEISMKARVEYFTGPRSLKRTLILCYEIPVVIRQSPETENEVEGT